MSMQEIIALFRRHLAVLVAVVLVTAGFAYTVKRTPLTYQETATAVFTPPVSAAFPNPYFSLGNSVVDTAGVVALEAVSPKDVSEIEAAGGYGNYQVLLYNLYNLQFPDYGNPYDTITVTGTDPALVQHTFGLVTQLIYGDLTALQAQQGVPDVGRIGAHLVGDSGVLAQRGSPLRTYAGLLALMVVAAFSLALFLDRHPVRIRRRPGRNATRGRIPVRPVP